ncbi:hypothetical protein Tco_1328792 [Tanacetum coccineum]
MGRAGKCTGEVVWPRNHGMPGLGFGGKVIRVQLWVGSLKEKFGEVFIVILLGFPGPSDGLRLHPIVFFSSGSGLTADSSVLTLTLAFLDFGLDFAQSFPFHAQFCHFGLVFSLITAPEITTATPEGLMGPIPTTEDTQEEDQGIDLGNLSPSYAVSSTPHTRIHKDHPIDHVIGDVQSSVQTRRMTTSYSELGFLVAL